MPTIRLVQVVQQLGLGVDRVMGEGSLYDRELAALAILQARGDLIEAIFLVRAYRTTLPRFGYSTPIDTGSMRIERRISATFKDLPGGQLLGPTFDYTHRLLDPTVAEGDEVPAPAMREAPREAMPRVTDLLARDGLIEPDLGAADEPAQGEGDGEIGDLTRMPLAFPLDRDLRLQSLARRRRARAGARLSDAARLCALASLLGESGSGRSRWSSTCPSSASPYRSAASG